MKYAIAWMATRVRNASIICYIRSITSFSSYSCYVHNMCAISAWCVRTLTETRILQVLSETEAFSQGFAKRRHGYSKTMEEKKRTLSLLLLSLFLIYYCAHFPSF